MPSAQELAESLGISRSSVVKAYEELIGYGLLVAEKGKGTFVCHPSSLALPGSGALLMEGAGRAWSGQAAREMSPLGIRLLSSPSASPVSADLPHLFYGAPPIDLLPTNKWKELLLKYCRTLEPRQLRHMDQVFGLPELRKAIADYLRRRQGIQCTWEQVAVFDGSQNALGHIGQLLVDADSVVLVENPGYGGAREYFSALGAEVRAIDLDQDGIKIEPLRKLETPARLCYVTPSHHDPLGLTMSLQRRHELLTWAQDNCCYVIEDAYDSDYFYEGPAQPTLQSLDKNQQVLYIYSFWKILFPLVTVGVLVVPPSLVDLFHKHKGLTERQFPTIDQYALTEFIDGGHLDLHTRKMRRIFKARRQALLYALTRHLQGCVRLARHSAGLHQALEFDASFSPEKIMAASEGSGLLLTATNSYYVSRPNSQEFLVPFAAMSTKDTESIVEQFAARLKQT